jgi:hypothetical protein
MHTKFSLGNLNGRQYSDDLDVEARIILEWIIEKSGSRWEPVAGSCEYGDETSGQERNP